MDRLSNFTQARAAFAFVSVRRSFVEGYGEKRERQVQSQAAAGSSPSTGKRTFVGLLFACRPVLRLETRTLPS